MRSTNYSFNAIGAESGNTGPAWASSLKKNAQRPTTANCAEVTCTLYLSLASDGYGTVVPTNHPPPGSIKLHANNFLSRRYSVYKAAKRCGQTLPSTGVINNSRANSSNHNKGSSSNDWDSMLKNCSAKTRIIFLILYDKRKRDVGGVHVTTLTFETGLFVKDVMDGTEELLELGMIYTTVDDNTWSVLEIGN